MYIFFVYFSGIDIIIIFFIYDLYFKQRLKTSLNFCLFIFYVFQNDFCELLLVKSILFGVNSRNYKH